MIGKHLPLMETEAPTGEELRRIETEAHQSGGLITQRLLSIGAGLAEQAAQLRGRFLREQRLPLRVWRELAALSLLVMGLSWTVPWFRSLSGATEVNPDSRTFLVFLMIGLVSYTSMRLLSSLRIAPAARKRVLLALLVVCVLAGWKSLLYAKDVMPLTELVLRPLVAFGNFSDLIPNEVIVAIAVLLIWRRGAVLSLDYIGPEKILSEFKTGFWMFLLFAGLNTLVTKESIPFSYLSLYLFSGLQAMGAARMSAVSETRGGSRNGFDRQRFLAVVFGVVSAAGFAVWIGFNFSRDDAALAGLLVVLAVLAAFLVSIPLLLLVLYLFYEGLRLFQDEIAASLQHLMELIAGFTGLLDNLKTWLQETGALLADRLDFLAPLFRWLFALAPALRLVVLAGSVLIATGLVYMTLWIRARRLRDPSDVDREAALSIGNLLDQFRRRVREALKDRRLMVSGLMEFQERRKQRFAARIRRLYRQTLDLANGLGVQRTAAQTPREFQRALVHLFPAQQNEVVLLTEAYLRVRYGEIPENHREVLQAEQAFRQIRTAAARHHRSVLKKG